MLRRFMMSHHDHERVFQEHRGSPFSAMKSSSLVNIAYSHTEARFQAASVQHIALATLLAVIAFGIGLACAPYSLHFDAADSAAERHLIRFSAVESNEREQYRWSEQGAAVRLFGLTRRPLIVDLRMTSPRPPNAAPAETRLALGSWRSNTFVVEGDWRRYQVLLPPRPGAPDLRLDMRTFRPAKERDTRQLGAAFTRVAVYPIDGLSAPGGAVATLGGVRAVVLLLLPVAAFVVISRLAGGVMPWFAAAAVAVLVAVGAARPVDAVALLPDLWLILVGTAIGVAIFAGMQPHLTPILAFIRRMLASDTARLGAVLVVASVQGLVFLVLVPPWEHPDETSHLEFAWLLAFHPSWPTIGTVNPEIAWIGGGGRALSHFPTYHLLVSLPLRLTGGLTVIEQLYIARSVSLTLFIATIAILGGIAHTLFREGHHMRWLLPLTAALLPSFADTMTAVNNDVGAVAAFSLFLWSAVTIIVHHPSIYRIVYCIASALLAVVMKNTSVIALLLLPLIFITVFARRLGWRWRTLAVVSGLCFIMICAAGAAGALAWGDPAGWYRYGNVSPDGPARVRTENAVDGLYTFRMIADSSPALRGLSAPVMHDQISALANKPLTIGAWVWASRPARIAGPGVLYTQGTIELLKPTPEVPVIDVDTKPQFFTWTFQAPRALTSLQVFLPALLVNQDETPVVIFIDGVVLVAGEHLSTTPPLFDLSDSRIFWGEQYIDNLTRNPSAEDAWPYLHPYVESKVIPIIRKSPTQIVASIFDIGRVLTIGAPRVPDAFWRLFHSFGSRGDVMFPYEGWTVVLPILPLISLVGCVYFLRYAHLDRSYWEVIVFLAIAGVMIWGAAMTRSLPMLVVPMPFFPRYGFPAIGPLALVLAAGWLAWWPARWRTIGIATLVLGLIMLNALAYATMWWHWYV